MGLAQIIKEQCFFFFIANVSMKLSTFVSKFGLASASKPVLEIYII